MSHTNKSIFAIILIVLYVLLPAMNVLATAGQPESEKTGTLATCKSSPEPPSQECPCSGEPDGDCCDTPFCSCSCHAPLAQRIELNYSPVIILHRYHEPQTVLTHIYQTIFVPPQNNA